MTNDTIENVMPKSIKNTSNIVTKAANGMTQSSEGTHHKQDGLVFINLTHFYMRALQCREEMLCSWNLLLSRSMRTFLSISIYEDTQQR